MDPVTAELRAPNKLDLELIVPVEFVLKALLLRYVESPRTDVSVKVLVTVTTTRGV